MIQPQEHRIGNYVEYKGQMKHIISIDGETEHTFKGYRGIITIPVYDRLGNFHDTENIWCEHCNPIPITPEILERCGFEYIDMPVNGYADDKHLCYQQIDGTIVFMPFCTDDKDCHIHIKYLHQLQNIIYSLSGQELTLKTTNNDKSI